jgi:putative phosphoesterase
VRGSPLIRFPHPFTLLAVVIAVISDTHLPRGRRRLPDACVERIRGSDLLLHAGDIATPEVLEEIEAIGPPVKAVHGNVDAPELRERLPESLTVDADGARIAMVHDAGPARGRLERMRRRFPDADAVVFGHSHIPMHEDAGDFQIFNPGSPTDRRRQPRHTMGVADARAGRLTFDLLTLD